MTEFEECNVALTLAIGGGGGGGGDRRDPETKKTHALFPARRPRVGEMFDEETSTTVEDRGSSERQPGVAAITAKQQEEEASYGGFDNGGDGRRKKKLRLSEKQLALLEDNFRAHTTLTPDRKQDLALRLDLRPRQVEVWFQNRRARTKLKQMEVDCEFLKKFCEGLRSENRRLKRELLELRSAPAKLGGLPLFAELRKAARVRICSSWDKTTSSTADDEKKKAVS